MRTPWMLLPLAALALGAAPAGAHGDDAGRGFGPRSPFNRLPAFINGPVTSTEYDGVTDDLLTAGLGKSGLAGATPAVSAVPTAAEIRRLAIYVNYRAIVDMTPGGGYGSFYGPNVDAQGNVTASEGRIAGLEALAFSRGAHAGATPQNVVLMVQVPASFDPRKACIVTATSSGSRGVYGAISVGEWGLKRGCAVAYTDKGTGTGPHDLATDTVTLIDGTRTGAAAAGELAQFRAPLSAQQLAEFNAASPNRLAFKHAHSQRNPERDWGRFTLQAVEFAYYVLNERYGRTLGNGLKLRTIRPENTVVIASSLSNGGGSAIAAAELDRERLIDGVAVSEPMIQLPPDAGVVVRRGTTVQPVAGRPLFDYTTLANLMGLCASQAPSLAGAPGKPLVSSAVVMAIAANRCASLKDKGLVAGATTAEQAEDALGKLQGYGWEPEAAQLHTSLAALEVAQAISITYANTYSRASAADALCGFSFAGVDAALKPAAVAPLALAIMAGTSNGVPRSAPVEVINDLSVGGPVRDLFSVSASTARSDAGLDGALCLRNLLTGSDAKAQALRQGISEVYRSGDLRGKPAIIVHGRDDALVPVNHSSRPYVALNRKVEGRHSRLRYIEVANAQHFDAFVGLPTVLPGYDSRYVPVHLYLFRALDALYAHLTERAPLPGSQVVRTVPRGGTPGAAPALTAANVPPIALEPAPADAITARGATLVVPD